MTKVNQLLPAMMMTAKRLAAAMNLNMAGILSDGRRVLPAPSLFILAYLLRERVY